MEKKSEVICKIIDHDNRLEVEFAGTNKQMLMAMRALIQLVRLSLKDDVKFHLLVLAAMAAPDDKDRMELYSARKERDTKD